MKPLCKWLLIILFVLLCMTGFYSVALLGDLFKKGGMSDLFD